MNTSQQINKYIQSKNYFLMNCKRLDSTLYNIEYFTNSSLLLFIHRNPL